MGSTKVKTIDDSVVITEKSKSKKKQSNKSEDGQKAQAVTSVTPSEPVPMSHREASLTGKTKRSTEHKPKHGKKYLEKSELVERSKKYPLSEAIDLSKKTSYSKFDGTLELHINTNQKNIRGSVTLPYASVQGLVVLAYKSEPNAMVIHLGVGKVSQKTEEIEANIKTIYQIIGKSRITKLTLSPTMGIGVKIDPTSI